MEERKLNEKESLELIAQMRQIAVCLSCYGDTLLYLPVC